MNGYEFTHSEQKRIEWENTGEILNTTIDELDFSVRTYNILIGNGKKTLRDISRLSKFELMYLSTNTVLGKNGSNEVIERLKEVGLKLREE